MLQAKQLVEGTGLERQMKQKDWREESRKEQRMQSPLLLPRTAWQPARSVKGPTWGGMGEGMGIQNCEGTG